MRRPRLDLVRTIRLAVAGAWRRSLADADEGARWAVRSCAGTLALVSVAIAQPAVGQRSLAIEPNVSVTQTLTDNFRLTAVNPASDSITRLTAGVGLRSQAGLLRGYLDYSLSSVIYARHSASNAFQNSLSSNLTADLLDGRATVVVEARISQSAVSAFGAQPGSSGLSNANSTELRTLRITPSFRGPLGPDLRYSGSLGYSLSDASKTSKGDSSASTATLRLEPAAPGRLSWAVDGSHVKSDYKLGRTTESDRANAHLNLRLDELDLQLNANAGVELTDLASSQRQRYPTWGYGAVWAPSVRIRLAAEIDHRFFGKSHRLSLEYRTPLTVWRLSDSRRLNMGDGQSGIGGRGTQFDLYFALFESEEPDKGKREELVNLFLRNKGIDPAALVSPNFLRSAATLEDRQELSVAWQGVRSSAALALTRTHTRRLDSVVSAADDLAGSNEVRLDGISVTLAHRLTPESSLSLALSEKQGQGKLASQDNRQRQFNLVYNTRLTSESNLVVGGRRAVYSTSRVPYAESAIFASYGIRY